MFFSDQDRTDLFGVLEAVVCRYGWVCHAYVLMDSHYHLLLETPFPNLSLGMRQLNGTYAQAFNRRRGRRGHLFGGRFRSVLVERDEHFLEAARYIVLNPIRTKRPQRFADWRWSSYPATAGLAQAASFLTIDALLSRFSSERRQAQRRYVEFVEAGLGAKAAPGLIGQIYLGSEEFVRSLAPNEPIPEVPRPQWQPLRPALAELCAQEHGILLAYRRYGYRLREIALCLGVHPATVSRRLRRLEHSADSRQP